MLKNFIILLSMVLLFSCGQNAEEKTTEAVLSANIALGKGDCQSAINTLEAIGRVNDSARYLKTLASAYACRAGFSTVTFFASEMAKIVSPVGPLNGLATFSTSQVPVTNPLQNDAAFRDLQTAINILLYAGGIASTTEPTSAQRAKYFPASVAGDINTQLLYMMLAQLGKFMYVYGNADATGAKSLGIAGNLCFTSYTKTSGVVQGAITASGATCDDPDSGHAQLEISVVEAAKAVRKTRLCHGVVLLNGIIELLPNIVASIFSNPADQASINAIIADVAAAKAAITILDGSPGAVLDTINQTTCEDNTVVTENNIETYYAALFESVFQ